MMGRGSRLHRSLNGTFPDHLLSAMQALSRPSVRVEPLESAPPGKPPRRAPVHRLRARGERWVAVDIRALDPHADMPDAQAGMPRVQADMPRMHADMPRMHADMLRARAGCVPA